MAFNGRDRAYDAFRRAPPAGLASLATGFA